jgi:hypothetical protein
MPIGNPDFGPLHQQIARVNEAFIDLLLTAARLQETEPLGAALLGLSDDALAAYSTVRKFDLMQASRFGLPLFVPRITEPDVLRSVLDKGFTDPNVIRTLTQSLPLQVIEKRKKA